MDIKTFLTPYEVQVRVGLFFGLPAVMATSEVLAPRRALRVSKLVRGGNNLAPVFLNSVPLRLRFPAAAVGMAAFAAEQDWGMLNYFALTAGLAVVVSDITLDFVIYLQHVVVHAGPDWDTGRVSQE